MEVFKSTSNVSQIWVKSHPFTAPVFQDQSNVFKNPEKMSSHTPKNHLKTAAEDECVWMTPSSVDCVDLVFFVSFHFLKLVQSLYNRLAVG